MNGKNKACLHPQRGVSLSGLLVFLAAGGMLLLLAAKVFPTFLEYRAAKTGILSAKATEGTVKEMQIAFDKTADINNISAITGKDLMISKDTGEVHVAFSYDKEVPLFTNVKLVIHYEATTDPKGAIPEPGAAPTR